MTVIVTKRLMLKEYDESLPTIWKMVEWLNNPDIVKYSEQRHQKHDVTSQLKYIYGPRRFRTIYTGDTFIGTITAHIDENNSVADVGILIGEKTEWGKGYGTEAWQAFCDVLLTGEGIRKIEAGCMETNMGMQRIFFRTGMHYEGHRPNHFQSENKVIDLVQWARYPGPLT